MSPTEWPYFGSILVSCTAAECERPTVFETRDSRFSQFASNDARSVICEAVGSLGAKVALKFTKQIHDDIGCVEK